LSGHRPGRAGPLALFPARIGRQADLMSTTAAAAPTGIIWDITYACPLRCVHCYSESGRRPSRQLGHEDMLRVADALVSLRPLLITLAGGEPLTIKRIVEVGERISGAGIPVGLYTGGWSMTPAVADELVRVFDQITVSVDGATADIHDAIRGRAGSFARAMRTLSMLDTAVRRRREDGAPVGAIGIDTVVLSLCMIRSMLDALGVVGWEDVDVWDRLGRGAAKTTPRGWLGHVNLVQLEQSATVQEGMTAHDGMTVAAQAATRWTENVHIAASSLLNSTGSAPAERARVALAPLSWTAARGARSPCPVPHPHRRHHHDPGLPPLRHGAAGRPDRGPSRRPGQRVRQPRGRLGGPPLRVRTVQRPARCRPRTSGMRAVGAASR
jgi:Radical SAM superfamily